MSIYEQIENSIIAALNPLQSASLSVVPLPENDAAYIKPNAGAKITVMYLESTFGTTASPVLSTGVVAQDEKVFIEVSIESRKFRGNSGIFAIWDAIKAILIGFRPFDCDRLRLHKFGMNFSEKKDSTWMYVGVFYCTRLSVQVDPSETYPLIKQINFDYENI